MSENESLKDIFIQSVQAVANVAPNPFLAIRTNVISEILECIEGNPQAVYAATKLRGLFAEKKWILNSEVLQSVIQTIGEVQFWMMSEKLDISIERIPETDKKTPDFCHKGNEVEVRCEVKNVLGY
jgi:hypothetical protein